MNRTLTYPLALIDVALMALAKFSSTRAATWLRGFGVGCAIAIGIGYVSYHDMIEQERIQVEANALMVRLEAGYHAKQKECSRRKRHAAMDSGGQWVCADDAPAWAMDMPLARKP